MACNIATLGKIEFLCVLTEHFLGNYLNTLPEFVGEEVQQRTKEKSKK